MHCGIFFFLSGPSDTEESAHVNATPHTMEDEHETLIDSKVEKAEDALNTINIVIFVIFIFEVQLLVITALLPPVLAEVVMFLVPFVCVSVSLH